MSEHTNSIQAIKEMLDNPETRDEALYQLTDSPYRNAAHLASKYLDDPDSFVRDAAIECIHKRGGNRYVKQITSRLKDDYEIVRVSAIEYLVDSDAVDTAEDLMGLLKDDSELVRAYSAWALGALEVKRAQDLLLNLSENDSSLMARACAFESLFMFTSERKYFDRLLELFKQAEGEAKCLVANSLRHVRYHSPSYKSIIQKEFESAIEEEKYLGIKGHIQKNLDLL